MLCQYTHNIPPKNINAEYIAIAIILIHVSHEIERAERPLLK